jgi:hypothetical protein
MQLMFARSDPPSQSYVQAPSWEQGVPDAGTPEGQPQSGTSAIQTSPSPEHDAEKLPHSLE